MAMRQKVKGVASSMPVGIGAGVILGLFLLGLLTFVSAWLVYRGLIMTNALGYMLMVSQLIGAMLGSWFAIKRVQRRNMIVGLSTAGLLFLLLLVINEVFFGGHYSGTLTTGVLFLTGTVLAVFLASRGVRKGYKRKVKNTSLCKIANR